MLRLIANANANVNANVNVNADVNVNVNAYSPKGINTNTHYSNSEFRILCAIFHKKSHTRFYPRVTS